MKRILFYLTVLAVLPLIGLMVWPVQIVTVTLPREGDRLFAAVRAGDILKLRYRHSVELTWVEGRFMIGSGSVLLAVETRFESVGTGLPNAYPERTVRKNGWLVVNEGRRSLESLRFFIVPINEARLIVAQRSISLSQLKSGTLAEVRAGRVPRIQWLLMKRNTMGRSTRPGW